MISNDEIEQAFREGLEAGRPKWIPVDDRLPEYDKTVLVINDDGYMHTAIRTERSIELDNWQIKFGAYPCDNDCWDRDEQGTITHWMPLPEPPKEE